MANFDDIIQEINENLPDNNSQFITAKKLRDTLIDLTNETESATSGVPINFDLTDTTGALKYVSSDNTLKMTVSTSTQTITLDTVMYEGKSLRDIFITNNALEISAGWESGNYSPMTVGAGTPEIVSNNADSGTYTLKCFGSVSTQLATTWKMTSSNAVQVYLAARINVVRYSAGYCGIAIRNVNQGGVGFNRTTSGYETISVLRTPNVTSTGSYCYIGTISSADADCYIDTPVCVKTTIFSTAPSKELLDTWYDYFVRLMKGQSIVIPGGSTDIDIQTVSQEEHPYSDEQCKNAFITEINKVAARIGAVNSHFSDASGLVSTDSHTTALDMFRILVHAAGNPKIQEKWGQKSYDMTIYGQNARTESITSTVQNPTYYDDTANPILGGKTGTLTSISPNTYNVVFITTVNSDRYLGTAITAGQGTIVSKPIEIAISMLGSTSDNYRWQDAQAIVTYIENLINGTATSTPGPNTKYVYVSFLPDNPGNYDNYPFKALYSKSATNTAAVPASLTKVISIITAYEYITDENELVTIKSSDLIGGSGANLQAGDIVTLKDLIYDMFLPSSNNAATAVGRIIGEKILKMQNQA